VFRLYHGDDYYNLTSRDNQGITCAHVYVLYEGIEPSNSEANSKLAEFKPFLDFEAFRDNPFAGPSQDLAGQLADRSNEPSEATLGTQVARQKIADMRNVIPFCVSSSKTFLRMRIAVNTTECSIGTTYWKQEFVFYAFTTYFPGTQPYCIRESRSDDAPKRLYIQSGVTKCASKFWRQKAVFYAYDSSVSAAAVTSIPGLDGAGVVAMPAPVRGQAGRTSPLTTQSPPSSPSLVLSAAGASGPVTYSTTGTPIVGKLPSVSPITTGPTLNGVTETGEAHTDIIKRKGREQRGNRTDGNQAATVSATSDADQGPPGNAISMFG